MFLWYLWRLNTINKYNNVEKLNLKFKIFQKIAWLESEQIETETEIELEVLTMTATVCDIDTTKRRVCNRHKQI